MERNVLSLDQALSQASSPRAPPSTPFSQASPSVSIHGINFSRSPRPSGPTLGTYLLLGCIVGWQRELLYFSREFPCISRVCFDRFRQGFLLSFRHFSQSF